MKYIDKEIDSLQKEKSKRLAIKLKEDMELISPITKNKKQQDEVESNFCSEFDINSPQLQV